MYKNLQKLGDCMFHTRSLLQFLHKTSLIILLTLSIIMLLHIFINIIGISLMLFHTDSSLFDVLLMTFLYYVIPLIAFLSFHLFIAQLIKLDIYLSNNSKNKKRHTAGTVPNNLVPNTSCKQLKSKKRPRQATFYRPYHSTQRK